MSEDLRRDEERLRYKIMENDAGEKEVHDEMRKEAMRIGEKDRQRTKTRKEEQR